MIDIHSHILPGIDDGAKTEADSLAMAKEAVKQGITAIIATPHHRNGKYDNTRDEIVTYTDILNKLFVKEDVPLTVLPGQETRLHGEMVEELKEGIMQPLNDTKYVFVEFPTQNVPRYAKQMLFDIQVAGYTPIIVHPERNHELLEHPDKLYELVKDGALTQVTAGSVTGKFGKKIQKFSNQIIEANLTHFIASDAHNTKSRGFFMEEALDELSETYGSDLLYLFLENSELIIDNQNVHRIEPERVKRKKFFGLF